MSITGLSLFFTWRRKNPRPAPGPAIPISSNLTQVLFANQWLVARGQWLDEDRDRPRAGSGRLLSSLTTDHEPLTTTQPSRHAPRRRRGWPRRWSEGRPGG